MFILEIRTLQRSRSLKGKGLSHVRDDNMSNLPQQTMIVTIFNFMLEMKMLMVIMTTLSIQQWRPIGTPRSRILRFTRIMPKSPFLTIFILKQLTVYTIKYIVNVLFLLLSVFIISRFDSITTGASL